MQPPAPADASAPAVPGSLSALFDPLLTLPPAHFSFALLAALAALASFALALRITIADLVEYHRSRQFLKAFASSPTSLAPLLRRSELPTCAAVSLYLAALRQIIALLGLDPDQPEIVGRLRSSRLDPARWALVHDATRACSLELTSIWARGLASSRSCLVLATLASTLVLLLPAIPPPLPALPLLILFLTPALLLAPLASLSHQLRAPRLEGIQLQILATLGLSFVEHAPGPALGRPLIFDGPDRSPRSSPPAAGPLDAPAPFSPFDAPAPPSSPPLDPSAHP